MNELTINCRRHGIVKDNDISKAGWENGRQLYRCRLCKKIARDKNYNKNPEKVKERVRKQKKDNPHHFKDMRKKSSIKYYEKHKDKIIKWRREYDKKQCALLTDGYIKHEITKNSSIKYYEIPQNLVEFKRLIIKLKRKIKTISIDSEKINKCLRKISNE